MVATQGGTNCIILYCFISKIRARYARFGLLTGDCKSLYFIVSHGSIQSENQPGDVLEANEHYSSAHFIRLRTKYDAVSTVVSCLSKNLDSPNQFLLAANETPGTNFEFNESTSAFNGETASGLWTLRALPKETVPRGC